MAKTMAVAGSVTVDFDFFLRGDALVHEELEDVASVVALKLDDVAPLGVLRRRAIAAPNLLKMSCQLLHVHILGQTTH